jgi:hypothetical protein
MSSILARAAIFAGRNLFGTRASTAFAGASAAAAAAAVAGSSVAFADQNEQSYIMLKPVSLLHSVSSSTSWVFAQRRSYKFKLYANTRSNVVFLSNQL